MGLLNLAGNLALASQIASSPGGYQGYQQAQQEQNNQALWIIGGIIISIIVIMLVLKFMRKEESFSNVETFSDFAHRSHLASTHWMTKPQIQHSFKDLVLQYPDHFDYFKNSCHEKEPNNAELCRYHKHRFDPAQM